MKLRKKFTKIEAFEGDCVFNAQIATTKILLSQPLFGILFESKSLESIFFAYFCGMPDTTAEPCDAKLEGGLVVFVLRVGQCIVES